jgi:predicted DNA-binding transcriptional regulator AlpA
LQAANDNRPNVLPLSLPPRGLTREQAAAYWSISPTLFDSLVADGTAPRPRKLGRRNVWDRLELDQSFDSLPTNAETNPWDKAVA